MSTFWLHCTETAYVTYSISAEDEDHARSLLEGGSYDEIVKDEHESVIVETVERID